ncbi:PTS mannose transporter subunit IIA [Sodalis sp. RH21]|uniref:PTS sugar transporter subunit IIA domain-containing protein n=1 Tax=unclassified Sodalis (in: enterobacteria) TaxID=2636512 RepID=UPI0039B48DDE
MITLIVTGHIQFASAMQSVVNAIVGESERIAWINFAEGDTRERLAENVRQVIAGVPDGAGILLLTDVPSGTPFQIALTLGMERADIAVVTGTNVSMITEALFERENMATADELAEHVVNAGQQAVGKYRL